ncbi:hypothetical protein JNW90_23615 [Micromonospora sp. STR1s_5]|nr:hypothetical protein [Micromonospora sp. STR1s_5]
MIDPFLQKLYTTSVLTEVAGVSPVTLRAWRNRNGLFPDTAGQRKWNRFSISDICIARTIVLLTAHGLSTGDAIWFAEPHLRTAFTVVEMEAMSPLVGFGKGADGKAWFLPYLEDQPISTLVDREGGLITILDLRTVISWVKEHLPSIANTKAEASDQSLTSSLLG